MKFPWIENYAGTWRDEDGRTLIITIRSEECAAVTLLLNETIMVRQWCKGKPARDLRAKYYPDYGPDLIIELGRPGFLFHVNYEPPDPMTSNESESLSVGLSRYESDEDLEKYTSLFGKLTRYKRLGTDQGDGATK